MPGDSTVVELDNMEIMTSEQALARAGRENYPQLAIIGLDDNGIAHIWYSGENELRIHWLLAKGADAMLAVT